VNVHEQAADLFEGAQDDGLILGVGLTMTIAMKPPGQNDLIPFQRSPRMISISLRVCGESSSKRPVMRSSSAPERSSFAEPRSPSSRPSAPCNSDLSTPVSPVQAQDPGCSSTRTSSIRARFCKCSGNTKLLGQLVEPAGGLRCAAGISALPLSAAHVEAHLAPVLPGVLARIMHKQG
jgi:hypothetical protein